MINAVRPKRIIEVGSGFSTACMLDTADELSLALEITCIEPDPVRLKGLLRSSDRVELLECPVQDVDISLFSKLEADDILFIDSTHVLKTGSDVHYELFDILPTLVRGVVVHFHDCMYPFEYHRDWVFKQNYSWNEVYAVRAFLMYNETFVPFYWHSLLARRDPELVRRVFPSAPADPGNSLWVRKAR
jgi:hypothetical protein